MAGLSASGTCSTPLFCPCAAWPVGGCNSLSPAQLACGACGRMAASRISSARRFEIEFDLFAEGWIEEIDRPLGDPHKRAYLVLDDQPLRHLAVDHKAVMVLRIDGRKGDLGGSGLPGSVTSASPASSRPPRLAMPPALVR